MSGEEGEVIEIRKRANGPNEADWSASQVGFVGQNQDRCMVDTGMPWWITQGAITESDLPLSYEKTLRRVGGSSLL